MTQSLIWGVLLGFVFCFLFFVSPCDDWVWEPVEWREWYLAELAAPDSWLPLNVRLLEEGDASKEILDCML